MIGYWKWRRLAQRSADVSETVRLFAHNRFTQTIAAPIDVTARAVCVVDADSGAIVIEKNADFRFAVTSLAKLATALLLARRFAGNLATMLDIEPEDIVRGSRMGLRAGDIVSADDLLHGMLIPSGNDAAQAAARWLGAGGNSAALSGLAAELGMERTRLLTPDGRDVPGQYSTARDLARLAAAAFAEPAIRVAAGKAAYEFACAGPHRRRIALASTVKTLGEAGIAAGKTGTTRRGGACLALLVERDGRRLIVVTLHSSIAFGPDGPVEATDRRYDDTRRVLAAAFRSGQS